jgi:hypothetical protein
MPHPPRERGATYQGHTQCGRCGSTERYRSSNDCRGCAVRRSAEQAARKTLRTVAQGRPAPSRSTSVVPPSRPCQRCEHIGASNPAVG